LIAQLKLIKISFFYIIMYSRVDILKAMKSGDIKVDPFNKKDLKPASVLLHLDNEFALTTKGKFDPLKCNDFSKFYRTKKLGSTEKLNLKPGQFVLGRTKEKIALSKKIAMLVDGTTTLARTGITVTQTAMLIHPGHGVPTPRKIVLEIKNDGPFTIQLTPGMPVADGIIFKLNTASDTLYDSKWKYGTRKNKDALLPLK